MPESVEPIEENKPVVEKSKIGKKEIVVLVVVVALAFALTFFIFNKPQPKIVVDKIVYDNQKYYFSYDIFDTDKTITMRNTVDILRLLDGSNRIELVFNDTAVSDFARFTTTGYNIVYKMQQYSVLSKQTVLNITTQYLSNATFEVPTILLRGPNSGAVENSVSLLNRNVVLVQGTTNQTLEMAGDKLVLAFIDINLKNPNFEIFS